LLTNDIRAEVSHESDRTCCVCHEPGKAFQIHHIDDDPSNNSRENLAILCLACHNNTQLKGGFGRHLSASDVRQFRKDWLGRVDARKAKVDEILVGKMTQHSSLAKKVKETTDLLQEQRDDFSMRLFVNALPGTLAAAYKEISGQKTGREFPSTVDIIEASYKISEVLRRMWLSLASYYPTDHFGDQGAEEFIGSLIQKLYAWHRAIAEPFGQGTGGTIVGIGVSWSVSQELRKFVAQTVHSLCGWSVSSESEHSRKAWQEAWDSTEGLPL